MKTFAHLVCRTPLHQLPVNRSRARCLDLLETVRILVEQGNADPALENSNHQNACQVFQTFFNWPSRVALRQEVSKSLSWLQTNISFELNIPRSAIVEGENERALFSGLNVDAEVDTLDSFLTPKPDLKSAFGPRTCPGSFIRGWTPLHLLMHFRVEPVWHPWSVKDIYHQSKLWSDAMFHLMENGVDAHDTDWQGDTPTSLALRSLFTFHLWRQTVLRYVEDIDEFIRQDYTTCNNLKSDGWAEESLQVLFQFATDRLYLHHAEWREQQNHFEFSNHEDAGLYSKCCWFQLLDILKTRSTLPKGWYILTKPRLFNKRRECIYWNKDTGAAQKGRPRDGQAIDLVRLLDAVRVGKDLTNELSQMGVVWQV